MKTTINTAAQIQAFLKIDEPKYLAFMRTWGRNYAIECYTQQTEVADFVIKLPTFWHWWKQQADIRDEVFLHEMESYANTGTESELLDLWADAHAYKNITGYPTEGIYRAAVELLKQDQKNLDELIDAIDSILK